MRIVLHLEAFQRIGLPTLNRIRSGNLFRNIHIILAHLQKAFEGVLHI